MNYRHAYHAGNFADCLKHAVLTTLLLHLRKKEKPFAFIDAHGGRGLYDIGGVEAAKTGEASNGIQRLLQSGDLPAVLAPYCDLVRSFGERTYPGSPLIAAKLLRSKDRLIAIEKHPEEYAALASALSDIPRARAVQGDFSRELPRLLPPPERRGLVLIDPPYEAKDEFARAAAALIDAHGRFATGIFLFWYPAKERPMVAATTGELLNAGISSLLRLELDVDAPKLVTGSGKGPPLSAAGLLVINPPFGFAGEMKASLGYLARTLGQGPGARFLVEDLAHS